MTSIIEYLPPPTRGKAPGKLTKLGDVRKEMARVYRCACRGEILFADATKAIFMLTHIAKVLRDEREEKQLDTVEQANVERAHQEVLEARVRFVSEIQRAAESIDAS